MSDNNSQPKDQQPSAKQSPVKLRCEDLPAYCPTESMGLWNSHPRVYIPLEENSEANCPYCGTQFILVDN